jgi:kynurenine formamidase
LEAVPFEDPERQFVGHQHLLAETGTFIVENLRTQELVERGVATFLWMMSPLNVAGPSASPVAPIAVI